MAYILVSGSLAYDRIMDFPGVFSDHLMPDKLHTISVSFTVDTFNESYGGTAGNIAYNLSLLGEEPEILASAGNDFEKYRIHLFEHGIGASSIRIIPDVTTAASYIVTDQKDNQIAAFYAGASKHCCRREVNPDSALMIVAPSDPKDIADLIDKCRLASLKFFFDPGQQIIMLSPEDLRAGVAGASALFANDYELQLIVQRTGWSEAEILQKTPLIAVTLGEKGTRIVTKDGEETLPAVQLSHVVDPTGAGDAHRAGFAAGYVRGLPNPVCARLANVVASFAVETRGTQNHRFTLDDVQKRYTETYGETVAL
jgi:adenosine kinase